MALETKVGKEVYTGSHLASMKAVATSKADLAAIDCVTWTLAQKYRPKAIHKLR